MTEFHLILTSTTTLQGSHLPCSGWSSKEAFGWRNSLLACLPDTEALTGHGSVIIISGYLAKYRRQFHCCHPWLGAGIVFPLEGKNNFETYQLDGNSNISSVCLCFVRWWINEWDMVGERSIRNATLPWIVTKLLKNFKTIILCAGEHALRWLLRYC